MMMSKPQTDKPPFYAKSWFWLGMGGILFVSLALRLWGLERFNSLVFDEVYYAKFASSFLKREDIFTGHPPLSTYIVAFGIWLGEKFPWTQMAEKNGLAGLTLAPFSYRWLNAVTGAFIPLWVGAIAYLLTHRRSLSFIAALLIAADGLYLVESRYALNNVYLITFGLWGQIFFLLALSSASAWKRWGCLALAGIGFGASAAIKWNGLGFLLGAYGVGAIGWVLHGVAQWTQATAPSTAPSTAPPTAPPVDTTKNASLRRSPLENLTQIHLGHVIVCLAIVPALTYVLSWLPYIQLNPDANPPWIEFWNLQTQTLSYHERVGGLSAHPYCSYWYTWPLMLRPIAYYYQVVQHNTQPNPITGVPLPTSAEPTIYDVHAMGNPLLWWLSSAAIVVLICFGVQRFWQWLIVLQGATDPTVQVVPRSLRFGVRSWTVFYLLVNWGANFFPWARVSRCIFLYHYMPSLIFAVLAIALLIDHWLHSPQSWRNFTAFAMIGLIVTAFIFWMPLYLGLPLSPEDLQLRRWLNSWV
ncbi:MAG: phospholipid carrier-dependent glycosyltransferase [Oculatellaceae cyanobacterium Prado106]|jgi:dolichyl-phosphate-mannose--protein O-mannosyl transferase|nr:phospholipid carrier-dependent glycosyltransferase [Oculatellaceae cyanobacterium Prado106]